MNILACKKTVLMAVTVFSVSAAQAQLEALTAGVAANQVMSQLDEVINKARDTGDYLAMRAAMEAKGVIETWKEANTELLNNAFSKLNHSQQQIFNNARQLATQANVDADHRLKHAEAIVNQTNQLMVDLPYNNETYVTQFSPRVIPAQTASTITIKVKGVNLDDGQPVLKVGNASAERMIVGPMEVLYTFPLSHIQRAPDKLTVVPLTLAYSKPKEGFLNRLFGNREQVQRQLPVIALPANVGRYSFSMVVETDEKQVQQFTSQQQLFEGRNTNVRRIATPPDGWQWDWSQGAGAFSQVQTSGDAGSCNGILANESSKDGIVHQAHLDERREVRMRGILPEVVWGPGRQNCGVTGPIFKMVRVEKTIPAVAGAVGWTEDLRLDVPTGLKALSLEVATFDGRKRVFNGTGNDKFFDVLQSTSQLIIQPKQPADI